MLFPGSLSLPRSSVTTSITYVLRHFQAGHGILTMFPSTTAFALALGADLPYVVYHCVGNLGFSAERPSTSLFVTYVSILTSDTSSDSHEPTFFGLQNAPLPLERTPLLSNPCLRCIALDPLHLRRRTAYTRPVSCYAFFKGWLLLSQPPGCLGRSTSFPT